MFAIVLGFAGSAAISTGSYARTSRCLSTVFANVTDECRRTVLVVHFSERMMPVTRPTTSTSSPSRRRRSLGSPEIVG
jgi:hypothetical protein